MDSPCSWFDGQDAQDVAPFEICRRESGDSRVGPCVLEEEFWPRVLRGSVGVALMLSGYG